MHRTAFEPAYTAFTADGARWLATHAPWVRTVAIDYLSVARLEEIVEAHVALFSAVSLAWAQMTGRGVGAPPAAGGAVSRAAAAGGRCRRRARRSNCLE